MFPPSKYNKARDWNGGPLERFIAANVRMPEATIGDINAQFAANLIGAKRLIALAARYGADNLADAMAETLNYSERRMRAAVAKLPDGTYAAVGMYSGDVVDNVSSSTIAIINTDPDSPEYLEVVTWLANR